MVIRRITLKYLSVSDIDKLNLSSKKQADTIIETVIAMIETVFDDKGVYAAAQTSHAEMVTFISSLNRSQMSKIEDYINNPDDSNLNFTNMHLGQSTII